MSWNLGEKLNACMSYPACKMALGDGRQAGAALVVALLVFAIAAALMVGLQRDFTLALQRGSNSLVKEQAWSYLLGAESLAELALLADAVTDAERGAPRDDLTELWAQEATPYPLEEGGLLAGQLEDLQGRFNLNNLLSDADRQRQGQSNNTQGTGSDSPDATDTDSPEGDSADEPSDANQVSGRQVLSGAQKQFIRLLQTLEGVEISLSLARELTDAIIDYTDSDEQARASVDEQEAYRNLEPPYRVANRPFASVSELRAVAGITPEIYRALAPLVTVWPPQGGRLNVFTAPATLLRSLNTDDRLDPLSASEVQLFVERRELGELDGADALLDDAVFSAGPTEQLRTLLGETSDWFLLRARVEIAARELQLYSVLRRSGQRVNREFRTFGEL